jgi:hypothetical protein
VTSRLNGMRRIRTGLATGLALLTLTTAAAGCSSSDSNGGDGDGDGNGNDQPIEGVVTEPAGPEGPDADEAADIAALENLYERYWDAMVELENSKGELDPSLLDGIATDDVVESQLSRMSTYKDQGIRRQGEPEFDNVTVEADGETARIQACIDEGNWPFLAPNGEELDDPALGDLDVPQPNIVTAERSSDGWLISGNLAMEEATVSC